VVNEVDLQEFGFQLVFNERGLEEWSKLTRCIISAQLMTAAYPTFLSRQEGPEPKTVNLDQLFVDDLCHSDSSRSFDEGYGKT
jgi:hypothetical protein